MRLLPALAASVAFAVVGAPPAAAQAVSKDAPATSATPRTSPMPSRAVMLEDVERSRGNVLKYLDVAPDSMMGYKPTPGVRTFAEQIEHAAGANPFILGEALKIKSQFVAPADREAVRRSKAAMRTLVNQSFDEFARIVRDATDAQLAASGTFANTTKSGWRWVATALEHTTWTLGQTVPYLRANGVTPPSYLPF